MVLVLGLGAVILYFYQHRHHRFCFLFCPSQSQSYPFHFLLFMLQHCKTRDNYLLTQPPCFSLSLSLSVLCVLHIPFLRVFLINPIPLFLQHSHFRWGQVITAKFGGGARWCFGLKSFSVSRRESVIHLTECHFTLRRSKRSSPVFSFPFRVAKSRHGSERIISRRASGIARYGKQWKTADFFKTYFVRLFSAICLPRYMYLLFRGKCTHESQTKRSATTFRFGAWQ